jgi:hypothetical protein
MRKIKITESNLIKIIETAMDLELYTSTPNQPSGQYNKDIETSTEEIVLKLKELLNMFETGKKVSTTNKQKVYKAIDYLNDTYEKIKYDS